MNFDQVEEILNQADFIVSPTYGDNEVKIGYAVFKFYPDEGVLKFHAYELFGYVIRGINNSSWNDGWNTFNNVDELRDAFIRSKNNTAIWSLVCNADLSQMLSIADEIGENLARLNKHLNPTHRLTFDSSFLTSAYMDFSPYDIDSQLRVIIRIYKNENTISNPMGVDLTEDEKTAIRFLINKFSKELCKKRSLFSSLGVEIYNNSFELEFTLKR